MPPKKLYCASCGIEVHVLRKALQGQVIDLVEPHTCLPEMVLPDGILDIKPVPKPINLEAEFAKFETVKKLNDLTPEPTETGDKRDKDHLRKELDPTSPQGLLEKVRNSII